MHYYNLIILEFEIIGIFIFFWGNFNFAVLILILYRIFIMVI